MSLYLGYDNVPSDGGGAQLHRIMNLYCIARGFNLKYVHFPITHIGYKGLHHLENNIEHDDAVERAFNSFFTLNPHCIDVSNLPVPIQMVKHTDITFKEIVKFSRESITTNTPILLQVGIARSIVEQTPDLYRFAPELYSAQRPTDRPFTVNVHLRRGELFVVDSWRMLPNLYYTSIIKILNEVLPLFVSEYKIKVHTEVPTKSTCIMPDSHGVANRIDSPVTISPDDLHLEEFNLPNVELCINEPPVTTLHAFATSDLFVMAQSSFSIVGAAVNKSGIILYHPFWHKPAPYWLNTATPDFPATLQAALAARFRPG
jgi:hypothetical protein